MNSFLFHHTRPEEQEEELAAATAEPKGVQAEYFRWDLPGGAQAVVRGGLWTELVEVIAIEHGHPAEDPVDLLIQNGSNSYWTWTELVEHGHL